MSNFQLYSDDLFEDIENANDENVFSTGRDSVVIAIDCCKEMFETRHVDEDSFSVIINAIHDMLLNKIITSCRDLQSVVFFGTEKRQNSGDFPSVYTWMDLAVPSVKNIVGLRSMTETSFEEFKRKFGTKPDHQMSDVLWECLNIFSSSTSKLASKTLLLFTWDSNPHLNDDNARRRTKAKAGDLQDHDVDVQVLSFNPEFSYDSFYKEIVSSPESIEKFSHNPLQGILNMYSFLLRKCSKQRPLTRIPLRFGDEEDLEMSVGVYTVARRASKAATAHIDRKTNMEAKSQSNFLDACTGDILMPSDIKYLQTWAGNDIVFEKEEVESMRVVGRVGISILGFKPRSRALKTWYHVQTANFIYPDEASVKGSTTLFSALLKKCVEKDLVAICRIQVRKVSTPKLCALLPQEEAVDVETYQQIRSPGFYVIYLPFADDIRNVDIPRGLPRPSVDEIRTAEQIVKKLRFHFDPDKFDNPALQTHYKNLEAMALGKEEADPIHDHTIADDARIEAKAGNLIRMFKEQVFPDGYAPPPSSAASKRKTAGGDSGGQAKKAKDVTEIDVAEYVRERKLASLTLPALKQVTKSYNIKPASQRKADVVAAIEAYVAKLDASSSG